MFQEVLATPLDNKYYSKNIKNTETDIYRLCQIWFGVTSSPFLLTVTLIEHTNSYLSYGLEFVKLFLKFLIFIRVRGAFNGTWIL